MYKVETGIELALDIIEKTGTYASLEKLNERLASIKDYRTYMNQNDSINDEFKFSRELSSIVRRLRVNCEEHILNALIAYRIEMTERSIKHPPYHGHTP